MNDFLDDKTKARIQDAVKQTQAQTEEAAAQLGSLLRTGAQKLREAIQRDINTRR